DGDGVARHGRAARRAHAFLHLRCQAPEMEVARHRLNPGVGDADDGPGQVVVRKADGLEHGARARARRSFEDRAAGKFCCHDASAAVWIKPRMFADLRTGSKRKLLSDGCCARCSPNGKTLAVEPATL